MIRLASTDFGDEPNLIKKIPNGYLVTGDKR